MCYLRYTFPKYSDKVLFPKRFFFLDYSLLMQQKFYSTNENKFKKAFLYKCDGSSSKNI